MLVRLLSAIVVTSCVALIPTSADACSCIGGVSEFENELKTRPLLVAGRVVETVINVRPEDVAAIRVQVLQVLRGQESRSTITIWDQFVNGSCSLELQTLKAGSLVVLAVNPDERPLREVWLYSGIAPNPGELLFGVCRRPWKTFNTEAELQDYIQKHRP